MKGKPPLSVRELADRYRPHRGKPPLRACRSCGRGVARSARMCPNCGIDRPGQSSGMVAFDKTVEGLGSLVGSVLSLFFTERFCWCS